MSTASVQVSASLPTQAVEDFIATYSPLGQQAQQLVPVLVNSITPLLALAAARGRSLQPSKQARSEPTGRSAPAQQVWCAQAPQDGLKPCHHPRGSTGLGSSRRLPAKTDDLSRQIATGAGASVPGMADQARPLPQTPAELEAIHLGHAVQTQHQTFVAQAPQRQRWGATRHQLKVKAAGTGPVAQRAPRHHQGRIRSAAFCISARGATSLIARSAGAGYEATAAAIGQARRQPAPAA